MPLDFVHCQIVDLPLADQFGRLFEGYTVSAGIRGEHAVIGHDQRRYELSSIANYHDVVKVRTQLQAVFDWLRRNIFTAGGDNKVFLPIGDFQVPLRVELPDIARMKPPSA